MAIARGAGTEILRSAHYEIVDSTTSNLIWGVQHHIYTVLSVIVYCKSVNTDRNYAQLRITGYDVKEGTTNSDMTVFQQDFSQYETFVWNDKFSFNGHEPTNFTGPLDDATKQDAVADQGSSVATKLRMATEHADDDFSVHVSYIDQNNA